MRNERGVPRTADEYLARIPDDQRAALERVRKTIRSAAPEAEEVISYRMPAFRHHGMLVFYAAFQDHLSLFVGGPAARKKFAAELRPYATGKGTVHFTPDHPLPADLVRRIVKARAAENEARAAAKARRGARGGKKARRAGHPRTRRR